LRGQHFEAAQQHLDRHRDQDQAHQPLDGDHEALAQHLLDALGQHQHDGADQHGHAERGHPFQAPLGRLD
jgi:hypothetical protein